MCVDVERATSPIATTIAEQNGPNHVETPEDPTGEEGEGRRYVPKGVPFTAETSRAALEARTAKRKAEREARQEAEKWDKMTLSARAAAVLSSELGSDSLTKLTQSLIKDATSAPKSTERTAASRALTQLLRVGLALPDDGGEFDPTGDPSTWTPAQRAAARASILSEARKRSLDASSRAEEFEEEEARVMAREEAESQEGHPLPAEG